MAHYAVDNDEACVAKIRDLVASAPHAEPTTSPRSRSSDQGAIAAQSDADSSLRSASRRPSHVVRHAPVLARISTTASIDEFQADLAKEMICGDARIDGFRSASSRTSVDSSRAVRARSRDSAGSSTPRAPRRSRTSSIAATAQGIPLLFVQDVSGFMVGTEAEHEGIIRAGARFVEAMATARVPKIVLTVNHASGAGYYAMAGQGFDPDFIFSWPTGRMAVMEGESADSGGARSAPSKPRKKKAAAAERTSRESVDEMRADYEQQLDARYAGAAASSTRSSILRTRARCWPRAPRVAPNPGPHLGPFVLPAHSRRMTERADERSRSRRRGAGLLGRLARSAPAPGRRRRVDYLMLDYLAEVTMSILQKQKERDPTGLRARFRRRDGERPPGRLERGVKVIANAGGVNPPACAEAIRSCQRKARVRKLTHRRCHRRRSARATRRAHRAGTCARQHGNRRAALHRSRSRSLGERLHRLRADRRSASARRECRNHWTLDRTALTMAPLRHEFGWGAETGTSSPRDHRRPHHRVRRAVLGRQLPVRLADRFLTSRTSAIRLSKRKRTAHSS